MSQINTNTIKDASGGNTATINGMTPTASSLQGFRNRIFNGGMDIDQRNAGAAVTVTNLGIYTVDRWLSVEDTDGTLTAQRSSVAPSGFTNSLLVTVTSPDSSLASTQYSFVSQRIEGFNVSDLAWGTASAQAVTVSFWVRSSQTGTFGSSVQNGGSNRSYPFSYTIASANTWEQKTITIPGDTSGTWLSDNSFSLSLVFTLASGSSFTGTANAWAASNFISPTGATNLLATNGATWYVTGVQLEAGSVATPFERRPYGTELALCQRYYEANFPYGTTVANFSGNNNSPNVRAMYISSASGAMGWSHDWKVPKRASPIVTVYRSGSPYTAGQLDNAGTGVTATIMNIGTNSAFIYATGNNMYFNFTVDAEL